MTGFQGLFAATLTPFDSVGRVDLGVVRAHTEFLIEAGVSGLCPCGTTGEWLYLRLGEKVRIMESVVEAAAHRAKVMAGVGALDSREIILLARAADSVGADAVFLTPPIYFPASDDVILEHYSSVRTACSLPVFAYNIPSHAANTLSVECVQRLVEGDLIAGIKDSTADSARIAELLSRFGARTTVFAASDSFASESHKLGAHGFISAIANVWPNALGRIWDGDVTLQPELDSARATIKRAGGVPALKFLASLRGFVFGSSRIPGGPLTNSQRNELSEAFTAASESGWL